MRRRTNQLQVLLQTLSLQTFQYQVDFVKGVDRLIKFHHILILPGLFLAYFPEDFDLSGQVLLKLQVEHSIFLINFNGDFMPRLFVSSFIDNGEAALAQEFFLVDIVLFQVKGACPRSGKLRIFNVSAEDHRHVCLEEILDILLVIFLLVFCYLGLRLLTLGVYAFLFDLVNFDHASFFDFLQRRRKCHLGLSFPLIHGYDSVISLYCRRF